MKWWTSTLTINRLLAKTRVVYPPVFHWRRLSMPLGAHSWYCNDKKHDCRKIVLQ